MALGGGAEDISDEGEEWLVTTGPTDVEAVRQVLEAAKIEVKKSELAMVPKDLVYVSGSAANAVVRLYENLDDHDDVQSVFSNFGLSDEEAARLSAE